MFKPLAKAWFKSNSPRACAAQAIGWLRVLQACEMDVLPPLELVSSIQEWGLPHMQLDAIPPMFLRAAWKAAVTASYEDDVCDDFVAESVVPLARWFFASGAYKTTGPDRLKAGWDSLKRLRRESVRSHAIQLSDADWPPVIHKYTSGPFVLVGLCNESDLVEEGQAMKHCVGSYADICRFEPLRVYSIRHKKTGARVATLSVRETKPGWWDVDQVKGPSNADAGPLLWPEIDGLLRLLNTVSRRDTQLRNYLDFVHQIASV